LVVERGLKARGYGLDSGVMRLATRPAGRGYALTPLCGYDL